MFVGEGKDKKGWHVQGWEWQEVIGVEQGRIWHVFGSLSVLRPVPYRPFHPHRVLQMLRENLEEEAIIMKDVPDWKVGPG